MSLIYLSGRIRGANEADRQWREVVKKNYPQHTYLDPTRHRFTASNDPKKLSAEEKAVVQADLQDIRAADVLLGHLEEYSAGTA
jgi:hypothetical protein